MKKKILSVALVVAMLAIAVVGSTFAYLNDTDFDKNVMTTGNVTILQNEYLRDGSPYVDQKLLPVVYNNGVTSSGELDYDGVYAGMNGKNYTIFDKAIDNEVDKFVSVKNTGSEDAFVRTIILYETAQYADGSWSDDDIYANVNTSTGKYYYLNGKVQVGNKYYVVCVYTYTDPIEASKESAPSLMQLYLSKDADNEWYETVGELDILVRSQAVQAAGFTDINEGATFALDAAFGAVTNDKIVEWFAPIA